MEKFALTSNRLDKSPNLEEVKYKWWVYLVMFCLLFIFKLPCATIKSSHWFCLQIFSLSLCFLSFLNRENIVSSSLFQSLIPWDMTEFPFIRFLLQMYPVTFPWISLFALMCRLGPFSEPVVGWMSSSKKPYESHAFICRIFWYKISVRD